MFCSTSHGGSMKLRTLVVSCCLALAVFVPQSASAQSEDEFAAWAALMLTPVGAFPTIIVWPGGSGSQRVPAWVIRASTWKFDVPGASRNYNLGASVVAPVGT